MNKVNPINPDWPWWAVDSFEHNGETLYRDKNGAVKTFKAAYAPGFTGGNPGGMSKSHAQQVQRIRTMGLDALETTGIPRLINYLNRADLSAKDLVGIVRVLCEISMPKTGDIPAPNINVPQIVITKEAFDRAEALDQEYREKAETTEDA